jgi:hypothetical protein
MLVDSVSGTGDRDELCLLRLAEYIPSEGEDRIQTPINYVQRKDRTMDNVQNCDRFINTPSSQTYK